jgi:hypothetical protein
LIGLILASSVSDAQISGMLLDFISSPMQMKKLRLEPFRQLGTIGNNYPFGRQGKLQSTVDFIEKVKTIAHVIKYNTTIRVPKSLGTIIYIKLRPG